MTDLLAQTSVGRGNAPWAVRTYLILSTRR